MRQILIIILSLFIFSGHLTSGEVKTDILQYRNNCLYFAGGKDTLIFDNLKYAVYSKTDEELYSGKIKQALEGISISYPVDSTFDTIDIKNCYATVQTANIDSTSEIILSIACYLDSSLYAGEFGPDKSRIQIVGKYTFKSDLSAYSTAKLSYSQLRFEDEKQISHSAPHIAYIIPNLSRKINEQAYLTTSLYYRNPETPHPYLFNHQALRTNSFNSAELDTLRAFDYDPERGKNLVNLIRFKTESVVVGYSDIHLKFTAEYFQDILAQDKFKVRTTDDYLNSDIYIDFAPFLKSNPVKTFEWIINRLESVTILYGSDRETVDIIKKHIESYYTTDRIESKEYYLKLIDYSLKYDLGIFPLFRPQLYLESHAMLHKPKFTEDGLLDFNSLQLISIPSETDSL